MYMPLCVFMSVCVCVCVCVCVRSRVPIHICACFDRCYTILFPLQFTSSRTRQTIDLKDKSGMELPWVDCWPHFYGALRR